MPGLSFFTGLGHLFTVHATAKPWRQVYAKSEPVRLPEEVRMAGSPEEVGLATVKQSLQLGGEIPRGFPSPSSSGGRWQEFGSESLHLPHAPAPSPLLQAKLLEGGVCTHLLPTLPRPLYSGCCPQRPPQLVLHKVLGTSLLLMVVLFPPHFTGPPGRTLWFWGHCPPLAVPLALQLPLQSPLQLLLPLAAPPACPPVPPHLLPQLDPSSQ